MNVMTRKIQLVSPLRVLKSSKNSLYGSIQFCGSNFLLQCMATSSEFSTSPSSPVQATLSTQWYSSLLAEICSLVLLRAKKVPSVRTEWRLTDTTNSSLLHIWPYLILNAPVILSVLECKIFLGEIHCSLPSLSPQE